MIFSCSSDPDLVLIVKFLLVFPTSNFALIRVLFNPFSLPFPVDGEDRADGGGDGPGPSAAPAHPGKGLSKPQTQGLEMVRNIMTSLEEEDGLEEVYTFRYKFISVRGKYS